MLPSPARRFSPGREVRMGKSHKRGRSFDYGLLLRDKEDDLALFTDMQMKEKDNLLLSNEDFDDSLAKLRCSAGYHFGMCMHVRGASDLLIVDSEKNDYDWLLTPPDTPLFPYLDDAEPAPANISTTRGRLQSQPMPILRSSISERSYRSSRSSASPHCLSPSPRSVGSTIQSRGRSSSTWQSSPVAVAHPMRASGRSPTPSKSVSPTSKSSAIAFRNMNVNLNIWTPSSGRKGNSPVKGSPVGSSSPKLQGWESSIPRFSPDAPPNLRTVSSRPASNIRGSSPASRTGKDLSSRIRRQSMSPTASHSVSSSHGHDNDHAIHHNEDSSASIVDDEVESITSIDRGISICPVTKTNGAYAINKYSGISKKPSRTVSTNSTPKHSLDSTLRQKDQHKAPQNMFRPLLSSVPISSIHSGKANAMHRPAFSRNSTLTTSSNASSELGVSTVPENEVSHRDIDIHANEWDRISDSLLHEGHGFENMDGIKEDVAHDHVYEKLPESIVHLCLPDSSSDQLVSPENNLYQKTCSICRKIYSSVESSDTDVEVCEECSEGIHKSDSMLTENHVHSSQEESIHRRVVSKVTNGSNGVMQLMRAPDIVPETNDMKIVGPHEDNAEQLACQLDGYPEKSIGCLHECCIQIVTTEECHDSLMDLKLNSNEIKESSVFRLALRERNNVDHERDATKPSVDLTFHQSQSLGENSNLKVVIPEATGISVLLKRSSSNKGPMLQARTFTASYLSYDEPNYARETANVVQPIISRNNSLTSSSHDMGSSRQMEVHIHQKPSRTDEIDGSTSELNVVAHESEKYYMGSASLLLHNRISLEETESVDRYSSSLVMNLPRDRTQEAISSHIEKLSGLPAAIDHAKLTDHSITVVQANHNFLHCHDNEKEASLSGFLVEDNFADIALSIATPNGDGSHSTKQNSYVSSLMLERELSASAIMYNDDNSAAEASTKNVDGPCRGDSKSLTLADSTDTILFCSSFIHDLAYKAAVIGIEKESSASDHPKQTAILLEKPTSYQRDHTRTVNKLKAKPQRVKRDKSQTDIDVQAEPVKREKLYDSPKSDSIQHNKVENSKPSSKCNCTIM